MYRISKNWLKYAEVYKVFCDYDKACFCDECAMEAFLLESRGIGQKQGIFEADRHENGFLIGKKYSDVMLAEWEEGLIKGLFFKFEIYEDPDLQNIMWWIKPRIQYFKQGKTIWKGG